MTRFLAGGLPASCSVSPLSLVAKGRLSFLSPFLWSDSHKLWQGEALKLVNPAEELELGKEITQSPLS